MSEPDLSTVDELALDVEDYFVDPHGRVELVEFEGKLSAIVWLWRRVARCLEDGLHHVEDVMASGAHRRPGWEGEDDMMWDQFGLMLRFDAVPLSSGVVILSATSLLESLLTRMLDDAEDGPVQRSGLKRTAATLATRRQADMDGDMLLESITWLAERRNSFAHQFIDEAGIPGVVAGRLDFTDDAVEEAFVRVGQSAMILADGWEAHLRRQGRPARAVGSTQLRPAVVSATS